MKMNITIKIISKRNELFIFDQLVLRFIVGNIRN